ncbi:MAG: transposase [Tatlockia sp.]|nr:transposase [Tatlockia sp.]
MLKPHLSRYWLNANPQNPETFKQQSEQICQLYQQAQELNSNNIHIISTDEMTGIQALERAYPTDTVKPGKIEFQEFEYIRHGTLSLIASWDVASGGIYHSTISPTRNENDFNHHIAAIIATKPSDGWIFVTDQLNTHKSSSLVRLIATNCGIDIDLGIKGKSGILHSMKSRAAFLTDTSHRIHFVYTPKHSSWLNQIECWFSILARRLLRRGNFTSTGDLKSKILRFIDYFNRTFAKPFVLKFLGYPNPASTD